MARKAKTDLTLRQCMLMVKKDTANIQGIVDEREKVMEDLKKFTEEKMKKKN